MRFRQSVVEKFWLSVTFINFLIIKLFKSVCYFMHVCIFGRFTFKILGQSTFTLIQCLFLHLEILLFITIFIHKHYYHFHYYYIITVIIFMYIIHQFSLL